MVKYKFFWKSYSPFSNWYLCKFTYNGKEFSSAEQAMMYEKAMYFRDVETSEKILKEHDPKKVKSLGREVQNFNYDKWSDVKFNIVKDILKSKFEQNSSLKEYLLKHKGWELVEASPYDRIWGIGYEKSEALENFENWGENLLGKILTELSNELD